MKSFVVLSCVLAVAVASYVPLDTPEVAAAKAQHLAVHAQEKARNWAGDVVVNQWAAAAPAWNAVWAARASNWGNWYAPAYGSHIVVANGHVQDTPEVAAEKAKHFALVAEAQARNAAAGDNGEWVESTPLVHSAPAAIAVSNWAAAPVPIAVSKWAAAPAPIAVSKWAAAPAPIVVANGHVQDTPEVAAEKAKHFALVAEAQARNAAVGSTEWADNAEAWKAWGAPAAVATYAAAAPVVAAIHPVANIHSQYHAQDEAGQYSYGYNGGLSTKNEQKTIDGVTRGAYSYVDANGLIQSRSYVADSVNGFRVAATDLPQGPTPVVAAAPIVQAPVVATPIVSAIGPVVVNGEGHLADTPEVAAAKAAHFAAHAQEHVRLAHASH